MTRHRDRAYGAKLIGAAEGDLFGFLHLSQFKLNFERNSGRIRDDVAFAQRVSTHHPLGRIMKVVITLTTINIPDVVKKIHDYEEPIYSFVVAGDTNSADGTIHLVKCREESGLSVLHTSFGFIIRVRFQSVLEHIPTKSFLAELCRSRAVNWVLK